jgi:aminopeptidase YwaD
VTEEGLPERLVRELSVGIGPRLGGSDGSHRARDVIAEVLAELGLDVRLQRFVYVGWDYERAPAAALVRPVAEELVCAPAAYTQASGGPIEGRVRLDGKVTVIPGLFEFGRLGIEDGGERVASLLVPPLDGPPYPMPLVQRTTAEPTVYVSKEDGDRIAGLLAEGEVVARLETFGGHVPGTVDWNVIGRAPGETDDTIVVSSHYDTAVDCPGAIDNASGVGAMAEIARRVRERGARHTFEFAAFAAEEFHLIGSEHFVEELDRSGELARYRGVVNFDPLGPGDTLEVWVGPEFLRGKVDRILGELGVHDRHPVVYREPKIGSDHYPFWLRGVPVCFPIFMPPPHVYHQPGDTAERVDPAKLATIVEIADAVARELDRGAAA